MKNKVKKSKKTWTEKFCELVEKTNFNVNVNIYPSIKNKNITREEISKQAYLALKNFLKEKKAGKLKPVPDNFKL